MVGRQKQAHSMAALAVERREAAIAVSFCLFYATNWVTVFNTSTGHIDSVGGRPPHHSLSGERSPPTAPRKLTSSCNRFSGQDLPFSNRPTSRCSGSSVSRRSATRPNPGHSPGSRLIPKTAVRSYSKSEHHSVETGLFAFRGERCHRLFISFTDTGRLSVSV